MTAKQVEEMTGQRRALLVVNHVCDLRSAHYRRIALAIGVFDGVHRGHQKLLQTLAELAAATGAKPVALTFHPHPRALLKPQEKPLLLLPLANRVELLHQYGAQAVVVKKFDQELATLSPQAFLDALLSIPELEIAGICVGSAWRFGHGGGGDGGGDSGRAAAGDDQVIGLFHRMFPDKCCTLWYSRISGGILICPGKERSPESWWSMMSSTAFACLGSGASTELMNGASSGTVSKP